MTETSEATCKREIELEIPAENVQKAADKITRDIAKVARIPGFRPGKAPTALIRRKFAGDIEGEVVQSLVPDYLRKALDEKKILPVTDPQVDKVEFKEGEPLRFHAIYEVLPEFTLADYKNLDVKIDAVDLGDAQVDKTIEELRERQATFVPVEGRPVKDGDYAQIKLNGTPQGGGDPVSADNIMCHVGTEETLPVFSENLRGASVGDTKEFDAVYPEDYPDENLKGKTYSYKIEVEAVKEKKLPDLNDEFAKEALGENGGVTTVDELRSKIRKDLEAAKEQNQQSQGREKILEELIKRNQFPVPESLVEGQMDVRLERAVRQLTSQGIDPRQVNVDWVAMRKRQHDRAVDDVKAEIIIDRIATEEKIETTEEELEKEIEHAASHSGESATALRARLTKQGALDRMKSKLRSDKTIDWLYRSARVEAKSA
ncbi:MAG TPA: trigger factor [Candidatus Acidoferrum sp.]|jgi:trigger factor|nr:trigger factor [Candidatus Acidoferrum sp.]